MDIEALFLNELGSGYVKAKRDFECAKADQDSPAGLKGLGNFFHRTAGSAHAGGIPVLSYVAAICEIAIEAWAQRSGEANDHVTRIVAEGLACVEQVLQSSEHSRRVPSDRPSLPPAHSSSLLENLICDKKSSTPKVITIDDDAVTTTVVDTCLRYAGYASVVCCQSEDALDLVNAEQPDLIILDVAMPVIDGFELCSQIRLLPALHLVPVIFLTRKNDVSQRLHGLSVGGNDYVAKPFEPEELIARVRAHIERYSALREMSIRDGLTRCFNQRHILHRLDQEIARVRRHGGELSVCMIDVDDFKVINDAFGHQTGDIVLANLGNVLTSSMRTTDLVSRYGGEEFLVVLAETGVTEAGLVANRIRERVANHRFDFSERSEVDTDAITVTVSCGVSTLGSPDDSRVTLIKRADDALYLAKSRGRNQVAARD